jgi:SPOR domain
MAEVDFDEFEGGYAQPMIGRAGRMVSLAGAACSVALIAGLALWGYRLAVRDVSGIPVVRALEGPLRIAPDNPGGEVAMHQGLSVNAVAAAGTALPLPEKLILAPKETDLAEDDVAGTAVLSPLPETAGGSALATDALAIDETAALDPASVEPIASEPVEVAAEPLPLESDVAVDAPLPATQEDAVAAALAAALADGGDTEAAASVAPKAAAKSVRPKSRPAAKSVATAAAPIDAAEPTAPIAVAPAEVDPASIAAGTRLVQLGAFDDEATARIGWADLQAKFPELMATKAMVVQPAQSGGRAFYRLRAQGFTAEDDARQFCAALLAENASCIPVTQK